MDSKQELVYSIPVTEKKTGETPIYRGPLFKDSLIASWKPEWNSLQEAFLESVAINGDKPYISQRNPANENKYETFTYKEIFEQAKKLAQGMFSLGLISEAEEWRGLKPKVVGIQSKNRKEWALVDIGLSWLHGVSLVCLYDTLGPDTITFILNHTKPISTFCDAFSATSLLKTKDIGAIKTVILFDPVTEEQTKLAQEKGVKLIPIQEVIDQGTQELEFPKLNRKTIMTFSYTSGTTGIPKGAMVTHENLLSMHAVFKSNPNSINVSNEDVYLSYLPLPHIFDRILVVSFSIEGAQIYFYGGDVLKLGQDILDARPTILASVPRLWNRFHDKIKASFAQKTPQEQAGIEMAINQKLENLRTKAEYKHEKWDPAIFDKIRQGVFGGRLRFGISGAAPISRDVIDFLKICFQAPLLEGYGQTESTGASFTTSFLDCQSGHVGGPSSANEFKLVDVPDMNYFSTDVDENGVPTPRGEVCYRGPGIFFGYYKDDEKTIEAIDSEGWLHSGDIGKVRPDGSLQLIDRKKNIFKLAQGEYIAPEKIEGVYKCVKGVAEIYVHGESLQATLFAVIVPDAEVLPIIAKQLGIEETSIPALCQNPKINEHYLNQLIEEGKKQKLNGFEQVKGIYLEPTPFMLKGILTSTMKLQRHIAKKVFETQIQEFYAKQ